MTPVENPTRRRHPASTNMPGRGTIALLNSWVGRSSRVALLDRHCKYNHANKAYQACHPERECGRDLPEQPADERRGRDGEAQNEVIEADGTSPERWRCEIHD